LISRSSSNSMSAGPPTARFFEWQISRGGPVVAIVERAGTLCSTNMDNFIFNIAYHGRGLVVGEIVRRSTGRHLWQPTSTAKNKSQTLDSDSRGSPNHGRLCGRIHPASSRGMVSRHRHGSYRIHRQWRLDGRIWLPGQGTPPESGGIEGVVRDAASWHVDKRSSGPGGRVHRRFLETHATETS
jgi:hypothetical protein